MFDWKGWDAAVAANPQLPRTGISPTTVNAQMMDDAWLSDGVFIWWDLVGLSNDIHAQRGIFSPQVGRHAVMHCPADGQPWRYLQLSSVEGVGLLRGWFQSLTTNGTGVPAGNVSVSMLQGYKDIRTVGFRTVIEIKPTHPGSDWATVYQRGSNDSCADAILCNASAGSLQASVGCTVTSCGDDSANVTLTLSTAMFVRTRLQVVRDAGGNFGVCVKATTTPSRLAEAPTPSAIGVGAGTTAADSEVAWTFYSGVDPSLSSVVQEEQAIVNATRIIRQCSCNINSHVGTVHESA